MKTSLEIINKLSEKEAVKLESQLVELASINDLIKLTIAGEKNAVEFNKANQQLISLGKIAVKNADDFRENVNKINSLASTLQKQFSDLGLNYLDNADVKKAVALLNKDREITQQAGYIKQII
jgi:hypothetical protein